MQDAGSGGDWAPITIPEFDDAVRSDESLASLASRLVLDRLPHAFGEKQKYLLWRDGLAEGFGVDGRDVVLVGSAGTGRSLNSRKQFGIFTARSDLDLAVVAPIYFERAWLWFREADPLLLPLDDDGRKLFAQHRAQYIYDGMIAANYFLSFLPFADEWLKTLRLSSQRAPLALQGRKVGVRIYKDYRALRAAQMGALTSYRSYLAARPTAQGGVGRERKLP